MQRKTLTRLILEKLADAGESTLDVLLPAKYPEARLWRQVLGLDDAYVFSPRTFSSILSRLQRQNLVKKRGGNRSAFWLITKKGSRRVQQEEIPLPPSDSVLRLVIFDIPEAERKKRGAIRQELVACGFEPLQKSVWAGKRPLSEDFLELLDVLDLRRCVHIFSVQNTGTLGETGET